MTGAVPPGGRTPGAHGGGSQHSGHPHDARDPWPRDFGRDGVSGLVTADRALRARDVSRPTVEDERDAQQAIDRLLDRIDGRRSRSG